MTDPDRTLGRVVMVMPTYNEATNLEWIVGRLRDVQPEVDVLVVDDGSPDGTGAIADRLAAADAQVKVVHRAEKQGLGAAYRHGFRVALDEGYDVIGEMDADGSHQPEELHKLLTALHEADLVIGSRWVPGGSVVNWPFQREALSRGGNLYVRLLLGIPVRDATAGYRLFRRNTLEKIDLQSVRSTGYVFQTDMAYRTLQAGLRVTEVPIEFVERVRGDSKMSGAVARESLQRITAWGLRERRRPGAAAGPEAPAQMSAGPPPQGGPGRPRRRRLGGWVLFVAFVVVPLVEIYVLIQVGQVIGAWWTIALLIADSILGSWLIRREGRRAWQGLTTALESGRMPARELADAALILVGGTLMLTPGFVSDAVGLFVIMPFTRPLARRVLTRVVTRHLVVVGLPGGVAGVGPGSARHPGHGSRWLRGPG